MRGYHTPRADIKNIYEDRFTNKYIMITCKYCKSENVKQGEGNYINYLKCLDCNMYQPDALKVKPNVILPDDPMDALACESCQ